VTFASRRLSVGNLQRRLAKIEERLDDRSNPNAPRWFEHWGQKAMGILSGQQHGRIPIEFWDAVNGDVADSEPSGIAADNEEYRGLPATN
jgi:hypothetical protein